MPSSSQNSKMLEKALKVVYLVNHFKNESDTELTIKSGNTSKTKENNSRDKATHAQYRGCLYRQ